MFLCKSQFLAAVVLRKVVYAPHESSVPICTYSLHVHTLVRIDVKVFLFFFQCFTVHFFISLNDKHQHIALHTQQYISLEC